MRGHLPPRPGGYFPQEVLDPVEFEGLKHEGLLDDSDFEIIEYHRLSLQDLPLEHQ